MHEFSVEVIMPNARIIYSELTKWDIAGSIVVPKPEATATAVVTPPPVPPMSPPPQDIATRPLPKLSGYGSPAFIVSVAAIILAVGTVTTMIVIGYVRGAAPAAAS